MVTTFNRKDLGDFGRYLLSQKRTDRILRNYEDGDSVFIEERLKEIYHADLENWLVEKSGADNLYKHLKAEGVFDSTNPFHKSNILIENFLKLNDLGENHIEMYLDDKGYDVCSPLSPDHSSFNEE